jgi:hypothetical protein
MASTNPQENVIGILQITTENQPNIGKYCFRVTWPKGSNIEGAGPTSPDDSGKITYQYRPSTNTEMISEMIMYQPKNGELSSISSVEFDAASANGPTKKGDVASAKTKILPVIVSDAASDQTAPRVMIVKSLAIDATEYLIVMLRVLKSSGLNLGLSLSNNGKQLQVSNTPSSEGNDNVSAYGTYLYTGSKLTSVAASNNVVVNIPSGSSITI